MGVVGAGWWSTYTHLPALLAHPRALGPGGGYILASANHIQHDVPPENVVAMYDEALKYGRYPLEG